MPAVHNLKTYPEQFQAIAEGVKTHELRFNDRDYQPGDQLHLREYDPERKNYTGEWLYRKVTHILSDFKGLQPGYVILSLDKL